MLLFLFLIPLCWKVSYTALLLIFSFLKLFESRYDMNVKVFLTYILWTLTIHVINPSIFDTFIKIYENLSIIDIRNFISFTFNSDNFYTCLLETIMMWKLLNVYSLATQRLYSSSSIMIFSLLSILHISQLLTHLLWRKRDLNILLIIISIWK